MIYGYSEEEIDIGHKVVFLFCCRLQYFAQGCQVYIKQLKLSLQGKTGPALQEEENKIKIVALRTTSNINSLIKVCLYTHCEKDIFINSIKIMLF